MSLAARPIEAAEFAARAYLNERLHNGTQKLVVFEVDVSQYRGFGQKEKRTTRPQNGRCVIPSRPGRITGAIRICRAGALPAGCFFSSFPRRTGGILSTSASN